MPYFRKEAALLERLENLAPNPSAAAAAVRAAARGYRSAESNARDLILTVWNVMDCQLEHTASVVNALVDTLDEEEKKQEVLASWKGFVVEVTLHPDLCRTRSQCCYSKSDSFLNWRRHRRAQIMLGLPLAEF
jgi:hypothetical protein